MAGNKFLSQGGKVNTKGNILFHPGGGYDNVGKEMDVGIEMDVSKTGKLSTGTKSFRGLYVIKMQISQKCVIFTIIP